MASSTRSAIFISYRRDDAGSDARALRDAIGHAFGEGAAFFDTGTPLGSPWPAEIQKALGLARTVLAVIGPLWITASDKWGRRRIDDEGDWVRRELDSALKQQKRVIPVLVGGAELPPAEALPPPLGELSNRQAIMLRRDFWDHDLRLLIVQLHEMHSELQGADEQESGPYPVMRTRPPAPLPDSEVEAVLGTQLQEWQCLKSPLPEDPAQERVELFREYRFPSFQDAIRFMREVSAGCDIADHHPRWENIYRTLRVYISTWGAGHRVTDRDVQLARYFDEVFSRPGGTQQS